MQPLTLILTAALVAAAAFALRVGDRPERLGALVALLGGATAMLVARVLPSVPTIVGIYVTDVAMGLTFLWLAVRYARLWLGAAMLLQAADLGLHSAWLLRQEGQTLLDGYLYFLGVNLVSWGMVGLLVAGALGARRRRRAANSPDVDRARPGAAAGPMNDVWAPVG